MIKVIEIRLFKCEKCEKVYESEEEALKCGQICSMCVCKKGRQNIYYNIVGYGKSMRGYIDFNKKEIDIHLNDDDSIQRKQTTQIKFCPYCGELL